MVRAAALGLSVQWRGERNWPLCRAKLISRTGRTVGFIDMGRILRLAGEPRDDGGLEWKMLFSEEFRRVEDGPVVHD